MNTMTTRNYYFFWKHRLSQWHMVDFVISGIKYCCCEQYMMHKKALLFNDYVIATEIMKTNSPKLHQELGRKIKDFDQTLWDSNKERIVYDANIARFTQSEPCRELLFSTDQALLVEASPYDIVWGVGLGKDDPRILNESNWRGQNLLGKILTKIRDEIKNDKNITTKN